MHGAVGRHIEALHRQHVTHEGEEANEEGHGVDEHLMAQARIERAVGLGFDVVGQIERTEHAAQEEDGHAEHNVPRIEEGVEAVPSVGPFADDCRTAHQGHCILIDRKRGSVEERANGASQEEGAKQAIEYEEAAIHGLAQDVARLALKLVGHCLKHKTEQYQHPNPIGTAETGAIEEGE